MDIKNCMLCEKGVEEGDLHQTLTFDADANIREMITELQDTQRRHNFQRSELSFKCLIKLRSRYRSYKRKN